MTDASLTAIILAYNEEQHIADCVRSVAWADRVVVFFDNKGTPSTRQQAEAAGAHVIENPFENFAQQRNAALDAVQADWVLFVDADERSSPAQAEEVRAAIARDDASAGYWVPRHNYIFGKLTRHTGWYPDYQLRLLKRRHARYDPQRPVHEVVILDGEAGYLEQPFTHYNYENARQFRAKQRQYVQFDARILHEKGIQPRPHKFISQPLRHFWWRFVQLNGYRDGLHGLRLSLLMAAYEFEKYRQLRRMRESNKNGG